MPDELYDDSGSTPSQAALDAQTESTAQSQQVLSAAYKAGVANMARDSVMEGIKVGGDTQEARDLLGRVDEWASGEHEDSGLNENIKRFGRTSNRAAPAAPAARAPAKKVIDKNQARRDYHEGKTNVYPG